MAYKFMNYKEVLMMVDTLEEPSMGVISRLRDELEDARNDLCYKCGNYVESHLGRCDGCRWYY